MKIFVIHDTDLWNQIIFKNDYQLYYVKNEFKITIKFISFNGIFIKFF